MRYSTIIVDDDPNHIKATAKILSDFYPQIHIEKTFTNPIQAMKELKETHVDLLILDIKINEISGIDIVQNLDEHNRPYIVYLTGHPEYAIDALKKGAFDYILKPFTPINFRETMNRLEFNTLQIKANEMEKRNLQFNRISINRNDKCIVLDLEDINRFQASGSYTNIYLSNNEKITVSKTLKHYDVLLRNRGFIRPHRAHLFNALNIREIRKDNDGNGVVYFKNGKEIYVTQDCKDKLILELNLL